MSEFFREVEIEGDRGKLIVGTLLDSGASVSLINKNIIDKVATPIKLPRTMKFELGEKGRMLEVNEVVRIEIHMDGKRISDEVFVADGLSEPLILGVATFQKWRIKLDFEKEVIEIGHDLSKLRLI